MKKKNILSLIFLLTILCGFNSCEDKPLDPIEDPEYILCNGSGWFDEYFRFPDDYEELESTFWWEWDDDYRTIYMEYSNGDYIYFDDLHIYYDELSGYLGDDYVTFERF